MSMQEQLQSLNNDELMECFLNAEDEESRRKWKQELVLRYQYLVKMIAMRLRGVYISAADLEDVIQEGLIALMDAVEKFDPDRKVKFVSYASLRVRGAMIDYARRQDWTPRSVRKISKEIMVAEDRLYAQLGRPPQEQEIAAFLGMSIPAYRKALAGSNLFNLLSIDALIEEFQSGDFLTAEDSVSNGLDAGMLKEELSEKLREAIEGLSLKEQQVLSLYYRKELNMKEIGKVLSVSESRISQILSGALRKLREALSDYRNL